MHVKQQPDIVLEYNIVRRFGSKELIALHARHVGLAGRVVLKHGLAASFFSGVRIRLGTILGRFSIIYFRGLGLRIRVRVWVGVRVRVRVGVRVTFSVVL